MEGSEIARVIAAHKDSYTINNGENDVFAELVGKIIYSAASPIDYPAVGDWVFAKFYDENTFSIIHEILPRKSLLKRKTPGKKIDFQLKCIEVDKFPELKEIAQESYFDLPQRDLIEMINQTIFAVSDDETRYFMNGVFLENLDGNLIMVATDGRRLSFISRKIGENMSSFEGVIIPPKILNLLRRLCPGEGNLSLAVSDKNIFVKFDHVILRN